MMEYKGYLGSVEFDPEAKSLFGRVVGIVDVVTFQADVPADVEREFHASVDDYLAFCKQLGRPPQRPMSGKLALRISPALHREIAMFAEADGASINAWIAGALSASAEQHRGALSHAAGAATQRSGRGHRSPRSKPQRRKGTGSTLNGR